MEIREFGKSGLLVPAVGMGTWRTFDVCAEAAIANARSVVDTAIEAGAAFFDSSPMYGEAERVLSLALRGRRDAVQIATKVWAGKASHGLAQARRSLSFFGDRIELYQIHNLLNWKEHLGIIERLKDGGKILAVGATHYSSNSFLELRRIMESGRIAAVQIPYNVEQREVERDILPLAADLGLGVVVMRPFGTGDFAPFAPGREADASKTVRCNDVGPGPSQMDFERSPLPCRDPGHIEYRTYERERGGGQPPWFEDEERQYVLQLARKY